VFDISPINPKVNEKDTGIKNEYLSYNQSRGEVMISALIRQKKLE
jgi:hypothetical protein